MTRRLHWIAVVLFLLSFAYDVVVWGALPGMGDVGAAIAGSARREAPLATTYVVLGRPLDRAAPALQAFGEQRLTAAFGAGFERIREDPTVAIDLVFGSHWNAQQRWITTLYWAAPLLFLVSALLWTRRPKSVHLIRR
ncbi:MAG TPA: hypothetical protein VGC30_07885 [Dokdonella sp.]